MKTKDLKLALVLLVGVLLLSAAILIGENAQNFAPDSASPYAVVINEICTKNETIIADNDGKYRDYIELYNAGKDISLEGFVLTDGKVSCKPFGNAVLKSGGYRLVFLGDAITGFALGASGGDCIQLLDPEGNIVAQANTAALLADQVMLYNPLGYETSNLPSPGYENSASGSRAFEKGTEDKNPAVVISEVLIGNVSSLPDESGVYSDVVELYNASQESVYLGNYCISDSMEQRLRYRLPDVELAAGGYLLIYCDGENYIGANGEIHTNFAIRHGETLVLTNDLGAYCQVAVMHCGDDISQTLQQEGEYTACAVSLGFENTEDGVAQFYDSRINAQTALLISEVLLSSAEVPYMGAFVDVVEIINGSDVAVSTAGWYLSDGGDPYEYPLPVTELQPGECLVICCTPQTTGFSLSEGEILRLTAPDHFLAPLVECVNPGLGMSISLQDDAQSVSYAFGAVTLGYGNTLENHNRYLETQITDGLRISEIMTANLSYLKGSYAETADWVEFYNASNKSIRLSDYCLTDDSGNLEQYPLPDKVLEAGEYCVIFLKGDPLNLLSGYSVLPFSLSSEGDRLFLTKAGQVVDYVHIPALATDEAYGRPAGLLTFSLLDGVTPNKHNGGAAEKCGIPTAVTLQGSYNNVDYLMVELTGDREIYYTTDCTTPGKDAVHYTGPIRITETTVLRVVSRQAGKLQSDILDLTYIINENDTLPVVSMVTDPDNLWSPQTGIYATGYNASTEFPYFGANFWKDWERPATVTLLEHDGSGFSVNCGIKIFGGYTVALPKKSLTCMFRDAYGDSSLVYPLFGEDSLDSYESVVLRASGQDATRARMRDVVVTSLVGEYTDVPVQDYKPVVLYLNGEYWGVYYFREKINKHYLAGHYNVEADTMSVVKLAGWSSDEYIDLVKYTASHDMTVPEYYDYVCSQIDVDNYIDFLVAQICCGNTDNGNVKYFVSPEGKWTWFVYDTDLSLLEYDKNSIRFYFGATDVGTADFTCKTFAHKLIENPEFRDKFLTRLAWQMNTIWTEENLKDRVDEIEAMIMADMQKECDRWGTTYDMWEYSVDQIRIFAEKRNGYLLRYVQDWFQLSDAEMRAYGFALD